VRVRVRHERDPLLYYIDVAATQDPSKNLRNIGIVLLAIGAVIQFFAIVKLSKCITARCAAAEQSVPAQNTPVAAMADEDRPPQDGPRSAPATEPMV
jgi:hypothetical protein